MLFGSPCNIMTNLGGTLGIFMRIGFGLRRFTYYGVIGLGWVVTTGLWLVLVCNGGNIPSRRLPLVVVVVILVSGRF